MYSERLLELFNEPRHAGRLAEATHYGQAGTPGRGPFMRLWLRVEDGVVARARFKTYGCPAAIACGEALCAHIEGRAVEELAGLSARTVLRAVGEVPPGKEHCPRLAAEAWQSHGPLLPLPRETAGVEGAGGAG
jgi:nitrogen fixation protein NifU and related proteins